MRRARLLFWLTIGASALAAGPTLNYATRLANLGVVEGAGICADRQGNIYVVGSTTSTAGDTDAFVTKLDAADHHIVYTAILGGRGNDKGQAIAVDRAGRVFVTGTTASHDFPLAGTVFQNTPAGATDAFIACLDPSGKRLIFASYLGGSDDDNGAAIALDRSGNALVAGSAYSRDLPTNLRAFQRRGGGGMDAFLARFRANGAADFCTYLGGSGDDRALAVAVDDSGNAYVTGSTASANFPTTNGALQNESAGLDDAFVAKLDSKGNLIYSTLLGGSARDAGRAVAALPGGDVVIAGTTESVDLPVGPHAFQRSFGGGAGDAFVARLNADATRLLYSTFLGGNGEDVALGMAVNSHGGVFLTGSTNSTDYPILGNASRPENHFGSLVTLSELNPSGSALLYSAVFGGPGSDRGSAIAAACDGSVHLTGVASPPGAAFYVRFTGFPACDAAR